MDLVGRKFIYKGTEFTVMAVMDPCDDPQKEVLAKTPNRDGTMRTSYIRKNLVLKGLIDEKV